MAANMDTVEKSNLFLSVSKLFRCLFAFSSVTPTFVRSIGSLLFLYMCRVLVSWLERYSKPRKKIHSMLVGFDLFPFADTDGNIFRK